MTAAFFLQHPSDTRATPAQQTFGLSLIDDYLRGGQPAVSAAAESARAGNSHSNVTRPARRRTAERVLPLPAREPVPTTTIHDVAVDGTFPAAGYEERVHRWARSVAQAQNAPGRE